MTHRTAWMTMALGAMLALASAGGAADYSSAASGNYNANATWSAAAHPGGGGVADTVAVNAHTVTVTAANDANLDTITIFGGGKLSTSLMLVDAYAGAAIRLNGGTLEYRCGNSNRTPGGNVLVQADSTVNLNATNGTSPTAFFGTLVFEEGIENGGHVLQVSKDSGANPRATFTGVSIVHDATVDIAADPVLELGNVTLDAGATLTKKGPGKLVVSGTVTGVKGAFDFQEGVMHAEVAGAFGTQPLTVGPGRVLTAKMMLTDAFRDLPINLNGGTLLWDAGNGDRVAGGNLLVQADSTVSLKPTSGSPKASFGTLAFAASTVEGGHVLNVIKSGAMPSAKFTGVTIAQDVTVNAGADVELSDMTLDQDATLIKKGPGKLVVSGTVTGVKGTFDFQEGVMHAEVAGAFGTQPLTVGPGRVLTAKMMLTDAFKDLPINLNGGTLQWNTGNRNYAPGGNVRVQADSGINLLNTMYNNSAPFGTLTFEDKGVAGGHVLSVNHAGVAGTVLTTQFTGVTIACDATVNLDGTASALDLRDVTLGAGALLTKTGVGPLTFGSTVSGAGRIKIVDGNVAIGGNAITVGELLGGTGTISGTAGSSLTLDNTAVLAPGASAGVLAVTVPTMTLGHSFEVEIGGLTPGADGHDRLVFGGTTLNLNGSMLSVGIIDDFALKDDHAVTIITSSSSTPGITGSFGTATTPAGNALAAYDVAVTPTGVVLSNFDLFPIADIMVAGLGGGLFDFDGNGSYDPDDSSTPSALTYEWDLNNDGQFDTPGVLVSDYGPFGAGMHTIRLRVTDDDGNGSFGIGIATFTIPEPGSLALLVLATVALGLRRRGSGHA